MKKLGLFLTMLICASCSEDNELGIINRVAGVAIDTINTPPQDFYADGSSKLDFFVGFNRDAILEKIKVNVSIKNASFEGSSEKKITLAPVIRQNGNIGAEFTIISTTNPDTTIVEVDVNSFLFKTKIKPKVSLPTTLKLSRSANSVLGGYRGEVTIDGSLISDRGTKVSNGVNVTFSDYLQNGDSANGLYRSEKLTSDSSSSVSLIYTPSDIDPNQFISIKGVVLDSLNQPTEIEAFTEIYIIE